MSRGASGEAAGRLVEEKVGVTAGIVTRSLTTYSSLRTLGLALRRCVIALTP